MRDPIHEKGFRGHVHAHARSQRPVGDGYQFLVNQPLAHVDPFGLEHNVCCVVSSTDICICGCARAKNNPKYNEAAGAVICYRGTKCKCKWPERYPFSFDPDSPAAKCLDVHEDYHMDNSGDCPPVLPDAPDLITPPPGNPDECGAFLAQEECLDAIPPEQRDPTWDGMYRHVQHAKEQWGCR